MKIKTKYYGIFYKNKGKWCPYLKDEMELISKEMIKWESGTQKQYLKEVRRQIKKPIKLMRQVWEEEV